MTKTVMVALAKAILREDAERRRINKQEKKLRETERKWDTVDLDTRIGL
jgi:hypothetical protein